MIDGAQIHSEFDEVNIYFLFIACGIFVKEKRKFGFTNKRQKVEEIEEIL